MNAPARQPATLGECEAIIERGLATFIEVGAALLRIRDERLYREGHATFEEYCRGRWGMDRTYAHRHIQAVEVVAAVLPMGNTPRPSASPANWLPCATRDVGQGHRVARREADRREGPRGRPGWPPRCA